MPGERISQAHGTVRPVDPETGAERAGLRAVPPGGRAPHARTSSETSYADVALDPDDAARCQEASRGRGAATEAPIAVMVGVAVAATVMSVAEEVDSALAWLGDSHPTSNPISRCSEP